MITQIILRDFQCHERWKLQTDEKITTIVGPSDQGKSAIVRALFWMCFNKPNGSSFIRKGMKGTSVSINVDGGKIKRRKDTQGNVYLRGKNEIYKALGGSIPEEIQKVLNVAPINFQTQHDSLFWFPLSPGNIAKELNSICDLSIMDRTQKRIASGLRETKIKRELLKERCLSLSKESKELSWVKEANKDLEAIEEKRETLKGTQKKAHTLEHVLEEIDECSFSLSQQQELTLLLSINTKQKHKKEIQNKRRRLQKILMEMEETYAIENCERLLELHKKAKQQKQKRKRLEHIIYELDSLIEEIAHLKEGKCPTCLRTFLQ